jgi:hypothetical protein
MFGIEMCADTFSHANSTEPPWRNWLARSAVNRKVGGSSPPGGALFLSCKQSQNKAVMEIYF